MTRVFHALRKGISHLLPAVMLLAFASTRIRPTDEFELYATSKPDTASTAP